MLTENLSDFFNLNDFALEAVFLTAGGEIATPCLFNESYLEMDFDAEGRRITIWVDTSAIALVDHQDTVQINNDIYSVVSIQPLNDGKLSEIVLTELAELKPKDTPWKSTGIVNIDLSTAAASFAAVTIPAGSVVTGISLHIPNTLDAATATNFSVGTSSDPDKYGEFDLTAADYEQPQNQWGSALTADEDIIISATDGSGSAAGTVGGGVDDYVQIRVCYYRNLPIYQNITVVCKPNATSFKDIAWKSTGIVLIDMSSAAASFAAVTIPVGSVVTGISLHVPNTLDAAIATNFSVGTSSDPDKYGEFALTAADYEQPQNQWGNPLTVDENIIISATDGSGAAAGIVGGGVGNYVKIRVCYYKIFSMGV